MFLLDCQQSLFLLGPSIVKPKNALWKNGRGKSGDRRASIPRLTRDDLFTRAFCFSLHDQRAKKKEGLLVVPVPASGHWQRSF